MFWLPARRALDATGHADAEPGELLALDATAEEFTTLATGADLWHILSAPAIRTAMAEHLRVSVEQLQLSAATSLLFST